MITDRISRENSIGEIEQILAKEPGLSVKDLASRLRLNRQFMAGFLTALEERGEVYHRQVGPARIYFLGRKLESSNNSNNPQNKASKDSR